MVCQERASALSEIHSDPLSELSKLGSQPERQSGSTTSLGPEGASSVKNIEGNLGQNPGNEFKM